MVNYAMICQNRVIEVLHDQEVEPNWPPDLAGNPVTAVVCEGTIERGMIYNPETGEFAEYIPPTPEQPEPSQLDTIEETQLIIMEAMADQYEQAEEDRLTNMEVQATIYETLLEMQGGL